MAISLELFGKILSFLGGILLTLEALTVKKQIQVRAGAHAFQRDLESAGLGDRLVDSKGRPLRDEQILEIQLTKPFVILTRVGIALVTTGFLLEIVDQGFLKPRSTLLDRPQFKSDFGRLPRGSRDNRLLAGEQVLRMEPVDVVGIVAPVRLRKRCDPIVVRFELEQGLDQRF